MIHRIHSGINHRLWKNSGRRCLFPVKVSAGYPEGYPQKGKNKK